MELDLNPFDGDDSLGINDVLDGLGNAVESIVDFVVPDGLFDCGLPDYVSDGDSGTAGSPGDPGLHGVPSLVDGTMPPELMNDGFYQSLPGVDSLVGLELDKTYELIEQIDVIGKEAVGEEAWARAGLVAEIDPEGMLDDIETPAEMEYRFTRDDLQSQREFWAWQEQQDIQSTIDEAQGVLVDPNRPVL